MNETSKNQSHDRIDIRQLSAKEQIQLRRQVIRMREKGLPREEIVDLLGLNPTTISIWWSRYKQEGDSFFRQKKKGRKEGERRTLTKEQEKTIQHLIIDKTPDQLKFPFALWDRGAVQLLIKRQFGITMPIRTVGEYLKRWGFTPQKPLRKAYEQNPKAVQKWKEEEYPAIHRRAKAEGAEIHWGDETGIRSDCQHGRGYAPKGKTPVQRIPAKRNSTHLISTITNQGKVRYMGYRGSMNAEVLIEFFQRLIKETNQKIFLILDNLRVHHAKVVKAWLEEHQDQVELFFLPSYSPELNPDDEAKRNSAAKRGQYLNCDLKAGVHSKVSAKTQEELEKNVFSHMKMLQQSPAGKKILSASLHCLCGMRERVDSDFNCRVNIMRIYWLTQNLGRSRKTL